MQLTMTLDERQVAELRHALYYAEHCHHGTAGHNLLMLLAKLSTALGFYLASDARSLHLVEGLQCVVEMPEGLVARVPMTEDGPRATE